MQGLNNPNVTTSYTTSTEGIRNGISYENSNKNQNILIQIKPNYLSLIASAGIRYGRNSFEISYWPAAEIVGSVVNPPTQSSFKIGSVGIFYYFSLTDIK
jgi:hypothetical protein